MANLIEPAMTSSRHNIGDLVKVLIKFKKKTADGSSSMWRSGKVTQVDPDENCLYRVQCLVNKRVFYKPNMESNVRLATEGDNVSFFTIDASL